MTKVKLNMPLITTNINGLMPFFFLVTFQYPLQKGCVWETENNQHEERTCKFTRDFKNVLVIIM